MLREGLVNDPRVGVAVTLSVGAPSSIMPSRKPHVVRRGPSNVGQNVRRLRIERGWSQVELAVRMRTDKSHVGRLETGEIQEPERATVQRFAEAFGVDPSEVDPLFATRKDRELGPDVVVLGGRHMGGFTDEDIRVLGEMAEHLRKLHDRGDG